MLLFLILISVTVANSFILTSLQNLNITKHILGLDNNLQNDIKRLDFDNLQKHFHLSGLKKRSDTSSSAVVPNRYLVKLSGQLQSENVKDHIDKVELILKNDMYGQVLQKIASGRGFMYSITCKPETLDKIKSLGNVNFIEPVTIMHSSHVNSLNWTHFNSLKQNFFAKIPLNILDNGRQYFRNSSRHLFARDPIQLVTQSNVQDWGLSRISGSTESTFTFPASAGQNVNIYIVDTGVDITHKEFLSSDKTTSRAKIGITLGTPTDSIGHGTHVAGIAAGLQVGVAKAANIWAQRCLDSQSMQYSDMMLACLQATIEHAANQGIPAIVNLSLKMVKSNAMDELVAEGTQSGLLIIVAAGNDGLNGGACNISPADSSLSISVGATDQQNQVASFSNHGQCVDIYAPGVQILSAAAGTGDGYVQMSGTSMATPFVVGVAALIRSMNPNLTPAQVKQLILQKASANIIPNLSTNPQNLFLSSNIS